MSDEGPAAIGALNDALESGSPGHVLGLLAPGAVLWHNDDKREMNAADGVARVKGLHDLVAGVRVDVVELAAFGDGWLQRLVLRGTVRATGRELAAHNCAVIRVRADGRISRIDEYVDPTMLSQLGVE